MLNMEMYCFFLYRKDGRVLEVGLEFVGCFVLSLGFCGFRVGVCWLWFVY